MKKILLLTVFLFTACAQQPKLLWTQSEGIKQPESVVYSPAHKAIFVSNINGEPLGKDGNGYISMLNLKGRNLASPWMEGLNAPKGLAVSGSHLYVADIDRLVVINIDKSTIEKESPIAGAKFLNDVTAAPNGDIYISDMMDNAVYVLKNETIELFLQDPKLEAPNGLHFINNKLYLASWGIIKEGFSTTKMGHILEIDPSTKSIIPFGEDKELGNLDGLFVVPGQFSLASDWMHGFIYKIQNKKEAAKILDLGQGCADISYIPEEKILLVPEMGKSDVLAYQL
ncbi:MAG: hypothetical protein ACD_73C00766G0002 [uncultured bacterium]|nr:MAG: hypothetical protein ACD_73C00766G0002 [uncultured bacterium]